MLSKHRRFYRGAGGLATPLIFLSVFLEGGLELYRWLKRETHAGLMLGATSRTICLFPDTCGSQKIRPNWPGLCLWPRYLAAVQLRRGSAMETDSCVGRIGFRASSRPWACVYFGYIPQLGLARATNSRRRGIILPV